MRYRMLISFLGVLALLVAACAGDNTWESGSGTPGPPEDPEGDGGFGDTGDSGVPEGPSDGGPSEPWGDPPAEEVCNGYDDNRDGRVDEGCSCTPSHTQACYLGPRESVGMGICRMGVQTCNDGGEFGGWGPCVGAVAPEPEICGDEVDQDCNGEDLACPPPDTRDQVDSYVYGEEGGARSVDIIWAIDQSGSMGDEIGNVQRNINRFADVIAASGADYHVIMLAARSHDPDDHEVCVPPPLGGPGCSDAERFRQIDQHVDSHNALVQIQRHITEIETFTRAGSLRVFIVVSDDESEDMSASAFNDWIHSRRGYEDYMFHAIVGIDEDVCDDIAEEGDQYVHLASWTGGTAQHICARDWGLVFTEMAGAIIDRTTVFALTETPVESSIRVFYIDAPGHEEEQVRGVAWNYDPAGNAITILDGHTPPDGTVIQIRYLVET